jgi:hypothetical protein
MKTNEKIRKAPIKVNQQVVKHLSLGLYQNFALAIKELISNSYDADATEVKLKLDIKNGKIILRDNGRGMDESEFKNQYLQIGFYKEPSKKPNELGRMRIGTFGIGFLAPLPYCKTLKVISKKKGQNLAIEGEIKADDFFTKDNWEINEDYQVEYKVYESDLSPEEGETIIVLEDIKEQIYMELSRETKVRRNIEGSGQEKFKWTLSQYCPIEFPPDRSDLKDYFEVKGRVPMKLWLDGIQLYRNVPEKVQILEKDTKKFGDIEVKYAMMTPYASVQPEEMRGLQLRLKDVAIGYPRDFDVTKLGRVLGRLNMLCGEVHIVKGLDDSLLVNRDSFIFTEDVANFYEFFRNRLTYWNEKLYGWADEDKELYLALGELREDDRILSDLNKSDFLHFSKERLRLSDSALQKSKRRIVEDPVDRVVKVLEKKAGASTRVVRKSGTVNPKTPAIKLEKSTNTITVYEDHPAFIETIHYDGRDFNVQYDEWDSSKTSFSICKLTRDEKTAIFNKSHPLFRGKLNDHIIKRFALGILLILRKTKNSDALIEQFNKLLEDTFGD